MAENTSIDEDKAYINRLQQMKDIIKLSSIALILIVLTTVSFLAYQNKMTPSPIVNQVPTGNLDSQVSNGNLANWKTYTNNEFNFELKYPDTWRFTSEGPNMAMAQLQSGQTISGTTQPAYDIINFSDNNKNKQFTIYIYPEYKYDLSPDQFEKGYLYMHGSCDLRWGFTPNKIKSFSVDSLQFLRVEGADKSITNQNSPVNNLTCFYIKNKEGNLIVLNATPTPSNSDFTLYDQILSTFQFTN